MKFERQPLIIAVDFDGTICEDGYPGIGKPHIFAFETLKRMQEDGHRLILWTYRHGKKLQDAVEFCRENGIEFLELPIALDAVTLVVSKDNNWLQRLSLEELATLWHSSSEKTITHWNQLNSNFPEEPVKLYAPGSDSGTYDYFTNVVLNGDELRGDYIANEDDYLLASKVATDPNALAFLGFAYYQNNQTQLKAVSITNHKQQAIAPSINSVTSGQYSSLSRPLFIYVNKAAVNRHSVNQFIEHYLNHKHLSYVVSTAGYIPLSPKMQSAAQSIFEDQTIGSVFNSKELSTNFEHFMERK